MAPKFLAAYCCARKGCGGYRFVHSALAHNEPLECSQCGDPFPKKTWMLPEPRRSLRDEAARGRGPKGTTKGASKGKGKGGKGAGAPKGGPLGAESLLTHSFAAARRAAKSGSSPPGEKGRTDSSTSDRNWSERRTTSEKSISRTSTSPASSPSTRDRSGS